jgi:hypothetical protein
MQLSENETLGAIIVTYRVLGIFKDEAKKAMVEIMNRKKIGCSFDFDSFINQQCEECKAKPIEIPLKF